MHYSTSCILRSLIPSAFSVYLRELLWMHSYSCYIITGWSLSLTFPGFWNHYFYLEKLYNHVWRLKKKMMVCKKYRFIKSEKWPHWISLYFLHIFYFAFFFQNNLFYPAAICLFVIFVKISENIYRYVRHKSVPPFFFKIYEEIIIHTALKANLKFIWKSAIPK